MNELIIEVVVVALGLLGAWVLHKLSTLIHRSEQNSILNIVDTLTDRAVELVEAEMGSAEGQAKKQQAIEYVSRWLSDRGIVISASEITAGIENGVNKLHELQATQKLMEASNPVPIDFQ